MKCVCPECGAVYSGNGGGHCRGGPYKGCCRTFTSDAAAAAHLVGPYSDRRCVDVFNDVRIRKDGSEYRVPWRETPRGWTNAEEYHGWDKKRDQYKNEEHGDE